MAALMAMCEYKDLMITWIGHKLEMTLTGEGTYGRSGAAVSLSANGTILAIGAPNKYRSDHV